jgi:hypothetical protein
MLVLLVLPLGAFALHNGDGGGHGDRAGYGRELGEHRDGRDGGRGDGDRHGHRGPGQPGRPDRGGNGGTTPGGTATPAPSTSSGA